MTISEIRTGMDFLNGYPPVIGTVRHPSGYDVVTATQHVLVETCKDFLIKELIKTSTVTTFDEDLETINTKLEELMILDLSGSKNDMLKKSFEILIAKLPKSESQEIPEGVVLVEVDGVSADDMVLSAPFAIETK